MVLQLLPSAGTLVVVAAVCAALTVVFTIVLRRLASTPDLHVEPELLQALVPKSRPQGIACCRGKQVLSHERIDGAVFLTGVTGFVGGATLFMLLARAEELGISRIVVLIRRRGALSAEQRFERLRDRAAFDEVRDLFQALVTPLEGDLGQPNAVDQQPRRWPHDEPLRAFLHCAADVRFDQRLQQAAVSSITASLQAVEMAARWGASRFIYVSTAFVHAVPSVGSCLEEQLVELAGVDPNEIYIDIINDGKWAGQAMRELGFSNTYTFTKAVAEHLVVRACASSDLDARVVRPSIVTPAWAAPYAGWCGEKPSASPIVAGALCIQRRAVRVFACSDDPTPMVPVDLVAESVVRTMLAPWSHDATIVHATIDSSDAARVPSFRALILGAIKVFALSGEMSLPEAGLLACLLNCSTEGYFGLLHTIFNIIPAAIVAMACAFRERVAAWLPGYDADDWKRRLAQAEALRKYSSLPRQYLPFSSPSSPWAFSSAMRLPDEWDAMEYAILIYRAAASFSARRAGEA